MVNELGESVNVYPVVIPREMMHGGPVTRRYVAARNLLAARLQGEINRRVEDSSERRVQLTYAELAAAVRASIGEVRWLLRHAGGDDVGITVWKRSTATREQRGWRRRAAHTE